jgi:hypothetical protein
MICLFGVVVLVRCLHGLVACLGWFGWWICLAPLFAWFGCLVCLVF